jgi:hypothetical protein
VRFFGPAGYPVARWRAQPLVRRRLQLLLASALAAFMALLLAIALRGPWVDLFLLMTTALVVHVIVGAYIGSREIQVAQAERVRARRSAGAEAAGSGQSPEVVDRLYQRYGIGGELFDGAFHDEVAIDWRAVLNDAPPAGAGGSERADTGAAEPVAPTPAAPADPSPAASADRQADPSTEPTDGDSSAPSDEATTDKPADRSPRYRRQPERRPNRRPKARPIYIEAADLDPIDGANHPAGDQAGQDQDHRRRPSAQSG